VCVTNYAWPKYRKYVACTRALHIFLKKQLRKIAVFWPMKMEHTWLFIIFVRSFF